MNLKTYKYFGIFLIVLTLIIVISSLFLQITNTGALSRGYGQFDYLYDLAISGVLFSFIVLALGFFPGLFYYRFGKGKSKPNKIIKSAIILKLISLLIMVPVLLLFIIGYFKGWDPLGMGIIFVMTGWPALILYSLGILLLIVCKSQTKSFSFRNTEKIVLLIMLLMILFVGTIVGMAWYEETSRSIEKCDNKQNPKDGDVCHYFFSIERPDLSICEKIRDTYPDGVWWRDRCYTEKAKYYKDISFCDKIMGREVFKENCLEFAQNE